MIGRQFYPYLTDGEARSWNERAGGVNSLTLEQKRAECESYVAEGALSSADGDASPADYDTLIQVRDRYGFDPLAISGVSQMAALWRVILAIDNRAGVAYRDAMAAAQGIERG